MKANQWIFLIHVDVKISSVNQIKSFLLNLVSLLPNTLEINIGTLVTTLAVQSCTCLINVIKCRHFTTNFTNFCSS